MILPINLWPRPFFSPTAVLGTMIAVPMRVSEQLTSLAVQELK